MKAAGFRRVKVAGWTGYHTDTAAEGATFLAVKP